MKTTILVWVLLIYPNNDFHTLPTATVPGIASHEECIVLANNIGLAPTNFSCRAYATPDWER